MTFRVKRIANFVLLATLLAPTVVGTSARAQAGKGPVKVFILAGQSNMEGQGKVKAEPSRNQGKGTLEYLVKDPATAERYAHLVDDDGRWAVRDDVWIWYLGRKGCLTVGYGAHSDRIGPELQFGHVMGDFFENQVLLIKTAWGGKSLAKDFRPPSAGGQTGAYYLEMLRDVKDVLANLKANFPDYDGAGYEIAGFCWHQGWNDGCSLAQSNEYEENLVHFIGDVRRALGVEDLPFVIANSGFGGPNQQIPRRLKVMEAQAAAAAYEPFKGSVACVETRGFFRPAEVSPGRQGYHWNLNAETYFLIGDGLGRAMKRLLAIREDPALAKVTFDWVSLDQAGLSGPPGGKVALAYEFCVPARPECASEVKGIDPSVRFCPGSRGRIGCAEGQLLCIGSTHQPDFAAVLRRLAALPYIERIDRCFFE